MSTLNRAVRWGTNALSNFGNPSLTTGSVNDGFGVSTTVKTLFTAGVSGEAQAAPGDSGGGLFYKRGSGWELLGILITTSRFDGQPSAIFPSAIPKDSAVYGNETFAVNLPTYRSQIVATIPEPASVALLGAGACLLGIRRRRPGNL